eukprot:g28324.t1
MILSEKDQLIPISSGVYEEQMRLDRKAAVLISDAVSHLDFSSSGICQKPFLRVWYTECTRVYSRDY